MRTLPSKSNLATRQILDRVLAAGQLTRREYLQLTSLLLSTSKLSEAERNQINRIFDQIQAGRMKLVD